MNTIELLNELFSNKMADVHISMPAKIVNYDHTLRKATVQPAINQRYNDGEVVEFPLIHNVPVIQPSSGGAFIHLPVKQGDNVLLVFSEKSLEEWLQNGKIVTPDDPRQNDLTDAIAITGLSPFIASGVANNEDVIISYKGSTISIKPDSTIEAETGTANIIADEVNISGNLNVGGNVTVVGNVDADGKLTANAVESVTEIKSLTALIGGKDFATHLHSGVQSGGSNTGVVV